MIDYNKRDIFNSLKKVGLKKNDIIFVNPELFKFGKIADINDKNQYYEIFLKFILEIIGPGGTLLANTYSFQTSRYKKKFIHEKTKCSSGTFSEIVRNHKGSIRSEHPVFSVSAIGKYKNYLCKNNSVHNYGYGSPYQRFLELKGKVLNLATEPFNNPFFHLAEFMSGVPYYYNKLHNIKYYKNNKILKKKFVSFVRYLDLQIIHNESHLNRYLKKRLNLKQAVLGKSKIYLFDANDYLNHVLNLFNKDVLSLVKKINFKQKKYPVK